MCSEIIRRPKTYNQTGETDRQSVTAESIGMQTSRQYLIQVALQHHHIAAFHSNLQPLKNVVYYPGLVGPL